MIPLLKKTVRRMSGLLDNFRLRSKFYLVYIFCVLLPVIATDIIVVTLVVNSQNAKRAADEISISEAVRYSLESSINSAVELTKTVYASQVLNEFLETDFTSPYVYYSKYYNLNSGINLQGVMNDKMRKVICYADNPTIITGGEFASVDTVRDEDWYKTFTESGRGMSLFIYYDEKQRTLPTMDNCRTFSLVRRLNYHYRTKCEKIVRIDLDYNSLQRDVRRANYDAKVYICSGENVIFTNAENVAGSIPFKSAADSGLSGLTPLDEFSVYGEDFRIYVVSSEIEIIDALKNNVPLLSIIIFINLVIPVLIINGVNRSMSRRIILLGEYFDRVSAEHFDVLEGPVGNDEIGTLITDYNNMIVRMDNLIQVAYKDKLAKQQAEMRAIYSQVNPHFLFNALESIRMHSLLRHEEETADIIGRLSMLLRRSLDQSRDNIPLEEEIFFASSYLMLQKYRFGEKLSYSFCIADECRSVLIPKLSIVTFIENACVHGIENASGKGIIVVSATKDENGGILIDVEDTGTGMTEEQTKHLNDIIEEADAALLRDGHAIGVLLAAIRLKRCYDDVSITIESEQDVGTVATVYIKEGKYAEQSTAG